MLDCRADRCVLSVYALVEEKLESRDVCPTERSFGCQVLWNTAVWRYCCKRCTCSIVVQFSERVRGNGGLANSYTFVRSAVLSISNDPAFSSLHRPAATAPHRWDTWTCDMHEQRNNAPSQEWCSYKWLCSTTPCRGSRQAGHDLRRTHTEEYRARHYLKILFPIGEDVVEV